MCSTGRSIGKCFQGEALADNGRFQGKKESRRGGKSVFNVRAQQCYNIYLFFSFAGQKILNAEQCLLIGQHYVCIKFLELLITNHTLLQLSILLSRNQLKWEFHFCVVSVAH